MTGDRSGAEPRGILLVSRDETLERLMGEACNSWPLTGSAVTSVGHLERAAGQLRAAGPAFDVAVVDLTVEGHVDAVLQVRDVLPAVAIVVITGPGQDDFAPVARRAGAHAHLRREGLDARLLALGVRFAADRRDTERQIERRARTDTLTGVLHRQAFLDELRTQVGAATRHNHALALCVADIDDLESVNTDYGHLVGDEVIRTVGRLLVQELRAEDIVGRYGGEEFAVILPYVTSPDAVVAVERIRRRLERLPFEPDPERPFSVTATFGLAELNERMSAQGLLDAAFAALRTAKTAGRNRTGIGAAAAEPPGNA
jgi:diguanylate cyclase (GGDEF)-like protein